MITLVELFDAVRFPMKNAETGKVLDGKAVLANPDTIVKSISFDVRSLDFVVELEGEE